MFGFRQCSGHQYGPGFKKAYAGTKCEYCHIWRDTFFKTEIGKLTHKWTYKDEKIELEDALAGYKWPGPSGNYLFTKEAGSTPEGIMNQSAEHTTLGLSGLNNWPQAQKW